MHEQHNEQTKTALAPLLQANEHVISVGTVNPGLAQFWAIIATILAILGIGLIPDAKTKAVAILLLLPISILMQLINMYMSSKAGLQSSLFAVSNQRLILFKLRKGVAVPLGTIPLSDVQSVDASVRGQTNTVRVTALDRRSARSRKLLLHGDTQLPTILRHAIENKSSR